MANTDKFIKGARRFSTTMGSGGFSDASATTGALSDFPSDYSDGDVVAIVVDRVNSSGTLTPDKEEVVIGVKSGSNLINCLRGVEGTAQQHTAGAVVEIKLFKSTWNRLIEGIVAEHNQDGTHSDITADSITLASGATPTEFSIDGTMAGNSDVAIPTEKAVKTYVDTEVAGVSVPTALQDTDHSGGSSTSSSTYANITGADVSITLTQTSHILLIGVVQAYANPGAQTGSNDYQVQFHDGTSAIGSPMGVSLDPGNVRATVVVTHVVPSATSGVKTYTLQHRSVDNALSCTAEAINMSAVAIPA